MIRCSNCREGTMAEGLVENYRASSIVGLDDDVVVRRLPALVCDRCGHIMLDSRVEEAVTRELARLIVRQCEELRPAEARLLREFMGMTQAALAEHLRVSRATVNRWEMGNDTIGPIPSLAVRTLAAWSLNDPALAKEVAMSAPHSTGSRPMPPYLLDALAA